MVTVFPCPSRFADLVPIVVALVVAVNIISSNTMLGARVSVQILVTNHSNLVVNLSCWPMVGDSFPRGVGGNGTPFHRSVDQIYDKWIVLE